jgi:hypothetical protein
MQGFRKLFDGTPEANRSLAQRLESEGVRSYIDELSSSKYRTGKSVVLVPDEEFEPASIVLHQWLEASSARADQLGRRALKVIGLGLTPVLAWSLLHLAVPNHVPTPETHWLVLVAMFAVPFVARIEHRRYQRERIRLLDRN